MNRENNDHRTATDNHLAAWQAETGRRKLTKRELNDCQRKPITDRIKELKITSGDFSSFNLNRKSSSHDSLNHVTSSDPSAYAPRHNFIDQTPDIIKDIPPEIKNSPPNDTTDESSKESSRQPSPPQKPRQDNQHHMANNHNFSLNLAQNGSKRTRRPLANKPIDSAFWRNQIKSSSFRSRPSSARTDPLSTTANSIKFGLDSNLYSRVPFPSASSTKLRSSPQFGLTQSTKLLQQYQKKTSAPNESASNGHPLVSNVRKGKRESKRENRRDRVRRRSISTDEDELHSDVEVEQKEGKENERKRSTRSRKCSNIPLRSQSFRRETDDERKANLSFETAITENFRSRSHQEINQETIRPDRPLWKTPSIEHIDRIRQEHHLKSAILGSTTPKAVLRHQKSPQSAGRNRAPRPRGVALFQGGDHPADHPADFQLTRNQIGSGFSTGSDPGLLSLSSNEEEEEVGFMNLRNNFGSREMDNESSEPPPPYHEVINQRKESLILDRKYIKPPISSSPHDSQHRRPRIRSRDQRIAMPEIAPTSSHDTSPASTPGRNPTHADIPFIDESPSPIQPEQSTVTLRNKNERKRNIREHRNSYISAVSQPKLDPFCRSLESITDVGDGPIRVSDRHHPGSSLNGSPSVGCTPLNSRIPVPIPSNSQSESSPPSAHAPVSRAGSMDSVLFGGPINGKKDPKRPESVDRAFPRPRASYIQATASHPDGRDHRRSRNRGRSAEKKNPPDGKSTLRRRPSLNKQLRKKLESMMTSSKVQFDDSVVERIRASADFEPAIHSLLTIKIKNRGSWTEYYVILYSDMAYLYIWKDEEIRKTQVHLIAQTNNKYNSSQNDLSGLILEVKLSDCLCDVDYSSRKKNVFKVTTTEKMEIYFACKSTEELKLWSCKISEISQSNLNINLIKQLTEKSKFNKIRKSMTSAQKSPNPNSQRQRLKNRPTFGVKLEHCPLEDDVPTVVRICCYVIEQRLEQDGTGIYRRNGNKPIVDQLEEEMNKNIEAIKSDHDLMKDVKNVASVLKSFFRKLPDPLFTDEYYDDFIQTSLIKDEAQKMKKIRSLLVGLPQHHYSTAKFLIRHLSHVAQSENTRMDSKNLATVIAPNLIRSTNGTLINDVKDLNNQCSLVDSLISKYDWFFELSNDDISDPPMVQPNISSEKPTDLTKLFHSALQNTPGANSAQLNQSLDESKGKSFFSGFKFGSSSVQNSKENLSDPASSLNRTDPVIRAESPQKVHKSRADRLEINPRSKQKSEKSRTDKQSEKSRKSPKKESRRSEPPKPSRDDQDVFEN